MARCRTAALLACIPGCLAGVVGCSSEPTRPRTVALDWPLAAGAQWVYRSVESDETGAELRVRLDTVRVLGDTAAFGRRWAVVRGNPLVVAGTIAPRQYLSWRPGGLWHAESLDPGPIPGVEPGTWVFPSPAEPGRYYPYAGAYARGVTAEATDDAVNTPAGAFRCVRFTHPYVVGASECVAPGVGLVEAVSAPAYSTDAAGNVTHTYWTTARLVSGPTAP